MELHKIPGLAEAVSAQEAEDQAIRSLAFIDLPLELAGVEVQQFCPRHFLHLHLAQSPFICGGPVEPGHVLHFFWAVSPEFRPGDLTARAAYCHRLQGHLPPSAIITPLIDDYIDDAFMDQRPSSGTGRTVDRHAIASVPAHYVHEMGAAYGWSRRETLDTPFTLLNQLIRLIDRDEAARLGHRAHFANRSTRVRREFVDRWLAAQAAPIQVPLAVPPEERGLGFQHLRPAQ